MNLLLTGFERLMVEVALTTPNPPDRPSMGKSETANYLLCVSLPQVSQLSIRASGFLFTVVAPWKGRAQSRNLSSHSHKAVRVNYLPSLGEETSLMVRCSTR